MNLNAFLFKSAMTVFYIIRLMVLIAPLSIISVYSRQGGWKYGFTFIQNSLEVGIFIGFALAFVIALYHALSFEVVGQAPLQNFLKSKQSVVVSGSMDMDRLKDLLMERWKLRSFKQEGDNIEFRKPARFMPADKVRIQSKGNGRYELTSEPFVRWWFIDFARNFKTVSEIARMIKFGK